MSIHLELRELPQATAKKPRAAWIVQIFCVFFLVSFVVGIMRTLHLLATIGNDTSAYWGILGRALFAVALVFTLLGTQRRIWYGRVLGLLFIAAFFVGIVLVNLTAKASRLAAFPLSDLSAYEVGELVGMGLTTCAMIYWFYAFGFSEKARNYFGRKRPAAANDS
ncbi:hypothetical protein [Massilia glaciei]|uniref:hypothetical protein n=1 Tax=Massilia glaciei TaxID=1524097 RepID=UPI0011B24A28|nr:hypothetical protein [Massilia glaciei]